VTSTATKERAVKESRRFPPWFWWILKGRGVTDQGVTSRLGRKGLEEKRTLTKHCCDLMYPSTPQFQVMSAVHAITVIGLCVEHFQ
jgi:hypothetical protein